MLEKGTILFFLNYRLFIEPNYVLPEYYFRYIKDMNRKCFFFLKVLSRTTIIIFNLRRTRIFFKIVVYYKGEIFMVPLKIKTFRRTSFFRTPFVDKFIDEASASFEDVQRTVLIIYQSKDESNSYLYL